MTLPLLIASTSAAVAAWWHHARGCERLQLLGVNRWTGELAERWLEGPCAEMDLVLAELGAFLLVCDLRAVRAHRQGYEVAELALDPGLLPRGEP